MGHFLVGKWRSRGPTSVAISERFGDDSACAIAESGELSCWGQAPIATPPEGAFTSVGVGNVDNRPRAVRCVHPIVTLLEKLDALMRRLPREDAAPATFVRHFEDAARIDEACAGVRRWLETELGP